MDREKVNRVNRAWECCNPFNRKCNECPYEKDCYHDGISRHMVVDALFLLKEQEDEIENLKQTAQSMMEGICLLKEQPQIVRCKDCHYGIRNSKEDIFCIKAIYNDKYKRPDWFCADGERR